jgi:hypothetical protein
MISNEHKSTIPSPYTGLYLPTRKQQLYAPSFIAHVDHSHKIRNIFSEKNFLED